jgi:hypothetical protein
VRSLSSHEVSVPVFPKVGGFLAALSIVHDTRKDFSCKFLQNRVLFPAILGPS